MHMKLAYFGILTRHSEQTIEEAHGGDPQEANLHTLPPPQPSVSASCSVCASNSILTARE
jgi:hypothetical protein